jgi:hypothetical protein
VVGLIVAEIVKHISSALLRLLRWNRFSAWIGLTRMLQKIRADVNSAVLVGELLFWLVLISFVMKACQVTGINSIVWLGRTYFDHVGNIFQAVFVLAVAGLLSRWVSKGIVLIVDHASAWYVAALGRTVVLILGVYAALLGVGLDRNFVLPLGLILFAGVLLALALQWQRSTGVGYQQVIRVEDGERGL